MHRLVVVFVLLVGVPAARASAQTANTVPAPTGVAGPPATVKDVDWLVGRWVGTGLGGVSEETWSAPAAGAMMGMYRLVIDDKVSFYEFMNLVEEQGTLALKLKHFNADLTGWEEKDRFLTFRLVKIEPQAAWFGGLTFRRTDTDTLDIFLAMRDSSGTVREERFAMKRR